MKLTYIPGEVTFTDNENKKQTFEDTDALLDYLVCTETKSHDVESRDVDVEICVASDDDIENAQTLAGIAAGLAWGDALYVGDHIELTMHAKYCPEDK